MSEVAVYDGPVETLDVLAEYDALTDECNAILVERGFNARQETIYARWEIGEAIAQSPWYKRYGADTRPPLEALGKGVGLSVRNLYYCIQFYTVFPSFKSSGGLLPMEGGKALTWTDIRQALTAGDAPFDDEEKTPRPRVRPDDVLAASRAAIGRIWSADDHERIRQAVGK